MSILAIGIGVIVLAAIVAVVVYMLGGSDDSRGD
jgi:hypothetical protein